METDKLGGLGISKAKFEVNNLSSFDAKIFCNQVCECVKVP